MNKTVQLVNEWASFEETHPEATLEEFCRYYLTAQRSKREVGPNFAGGGVPAAPKSHLMKLLAFLSRAAHTYFEKAFETIPEIKQKEDFFFLNIIGNKEACRKTDVINEQLLGLSTGIDTLNRLIAHELITERANPADKRAKLLTITDKGREVLDRAYGVARKVNEILLHDMTDEDAKLCIQLLRGAEARQSAIIFEMRDMPLDEVYDRVVGKSQVTEKTKP
ncbi:MAG: winged helix DNA-binding protein [Saprospiraceae bacterium]|nr:winged helix DNA-binding protein [Saprospiraceae bacterium]